MSSPIPNTYELVESLKVQAGLLIQASEMEAGDSPDARDEFTHQQLRRASELVKGGHSCRT